MSGKRTPVGFAGQCYPSFVRSRFRAAIDASHMAAAPEIPVPEVFTVPISGLTIRCSCKLLEAPGG